MSSVQTQTIQTQAELQGAGTHQSIACKALLDAINEAIAAGSDAWSDPGTRHEAAERLISERLSAGKPLMRHEGEPMIGVELYAHDPATLLGVAERMQKNHAIDAEGGSIFALGSDGVAKAFLDSVNEQAGKSFSRSKGKSRKVDDDDDDDDYLPEDATPAEQVSSTTTMSLVQKAIAQTDCAILKFLDDALEAGSKIEIFGTKLAKEISAKYDVVSYNKKDGWRERSDNMVVTRMREIVQKEVELARKTATKVKIDVRDLIENGSQAVPRRAKEIDYPRNQPYATGTHPDLAQNQKVKTRAATAPPAAKSAPIAKEKVKNTSATGLPAAKRAPIDLTEGNADEIVPSQPRQTKRKRVDNPSNQDPDFDDVEVEKPKKKLRLNAGASKSLEDIRREDTDLSKKRKRDDGESDQDSEDSSSTSRSKRPRMDDAKVDGVSSRSHPLVIQQPLVPELTHEQRIAMLNFTQPASAIEKSMNDMWGWVKNAIFQEYSKLGIMRDPLPAVFHEYEKESPDLHKLYHALLGEGPDAYRRFAIIDRMDSVALTQALAGAFFCHEVFGAAEVPDAQSQLARLKEIFGSELEKYMRRINQFARIPFTIERVVTWMYGEDVAREPEAVLGTTANKLARTLSRVIRDQVVLQCQKAGITYSDVEKSTLTMQQRLYPRVLEGLVLKMQLKADRLAYELRWSTAGTTFDRKEMQGENGPDPEVIAPCWPGIVCVTPGSETHPFRIRVWTGRKTNEKDLEVV